MKDGRTGFSTSSTGSNSMSLPQIIAGIGLPANIRAAVLPQLLCVLQALMSTFLEREMSTLACEADLAARELRAGGGSSVAFGVVMVCGAGPLLRGRLVP